MWDAHGTPGPNSLKKKKSKTEIDCLRSKKLNKNTLGYKWTLLKKWTTQNNVHISANFAMISMIFKSDIELGVYHISCFICVCPFVALSKAKFAESESEKFAQCFV